MISLSRRKSFLIRWAPALAMMAFIFLLSGMPSETLPNAGPFDLLLKKGGHMIGYALLGLAYLRGIGDERPNARIYALTLAVFYAITDEIHQRFVPGRSSWFMDVGIDGIGAAIALFLPRLNPIRRLLPKF